MLISNSDLVSIKFEIHRLAILIYIIIAKKFPLSPLKSRCLVLLSLHLQNISNTFMCISVHSVHRSNMCFLSFNWRKSTFIPLPSPTISKYQNSCWLIVTSAKHEPSGSNCDITMTDCSRAVSMDAFLSQWRWSQGVKEFTRCKSVPSFSIVIIERICGVVNSLASSILSSGQGQCTRYE